MSTQFVDPRDGQLGFDGEDRARWEAEKATDSVPGLRKKDKRGLKNTWVRHLLRLVYVCYVSKLEVF